MVVRASQIVQMYQQAKDSLFTVNIRNFIGNTQTNKAIIRTAREDPLHFFHYNNGIACLAKKIELNEAEDRLITEGIQIINEAQTVKSLFRANQSKPSSEDPLILVRVTEVSKGYGEHGRFTNDVTRYNNTQNVIKASDFRSNDPVQVDLRDKFAKHTRFGKSVEYAPKRTDSRRTNSTVIRLEEFAKMIYSFLCDPIQFSGSTSFLFDDSDKGGYRYVFGDGQQVWTTMPDEEFKLRSAIWWMADAFAPQIKSDRANASDALEKAALERKWFIFFASRLVLERSFGDKKYAEQLRLRWRGEWIFGEERVGQWFKELYDRAKQSVVFVYKQAAKQRTFVHRNWMRSADTVTSLREFVIESPFSAISSIAPTRE
jgi:AIPR protein